MHIVFDELLESFREFGRARQSERDKGTSFEVFCVKLLRAWDRFNDFEKVDLWSSWGFGESDSGIDVVAKNHNDEYIAIQCKCYDENTLPPLLRLPLGLTN